MNHLKIFSASSSRGNLMGTDVSGREDFFLHDGQTRHARSLARLEVALHRIGDLLAKIVHRVRFGEDRFSKGPGRKAALRRFFDHEDQLAHEGTRADSPESRKPDCTSCQLVAAATRLAFSPAVFRSFGLLVPLHALRKEAA